MRKGEVESFVKVGLGKVLFSDRSHFLPYHGLDHFTPVPFHPGTISVRDRTPSCRVSTYPSVVSRRSLGLGVEKREPREEVKRREVGLVLDRNSLD